MSEGQLLTEGASRVADCLDGVAQALAGTRLDGLVSAERDLAAALASWVTIPVSRCADEAPPLLLELARVRANLERCRRLGAALDAVALASAAVHTLTRGYDNRGAAAHAAGGTTSWEASA